MCHEVLRVSRAGVICMCPVSQLKCRTFSTIFVKIDSKTTCRVFGAGAHQKVAPAFVSEVRIRKAFATRSSWGNCWILTKGQNSSDPRTVPIFYCVMHKCRVLVKSLSNPGIRNLIDICMRFYSIPSLWFFPKKIMVHHCFKQLRFFAYVWYRYIL